MGVGLVYAAMDLEELLGGGSGHEGEECEAGRFVECTGISFVNFCLL